MLRLALGFIMALSSAVALASPSGPVESQIIKCENKSQGLSFNVKLDNFTEDSSEADVKIDVKLKNRTQFQGNLVREKIAPASNPGNIAITGEGKSKNFTLEVVLPQTQIKKNFKNVTMSAFLDNPLSDQGFYPHRVPVKCSSRIN